MTEPFYVAQTFEPDAVQSQDSRMQWWRSHAIKARATGGVWNRYSVMNDVDEAGNDGLLFECWRERPSDEGVPRWNLTNQRTING